MVKKPNEEITIADLYPELSEEEQQVAEENLRAYIDLIERMYLQLKADDQLDELLLRSQWEKRFGNDESDITASQK